MTMNKNLFSYNCNLQAAPATWMGRSAKANSSGLTIWGENFATNFGLESCVNLFSVGTRCLEITIVGFKKAGGL